MSLGGPEAAAFCIATTEQPVPRAFITPEEHDALKDKTAQALHNLVTLDAFQRAVAPENPTTEIEVFVIYPQQNDLASELRRAGADRLLDYLFADKDGDDPEATRAELAPYKDEDIRIVAVRHYPKLDVPSEPIAATRLIGPTPGHPPHSLLAIGAEWGKDIAATITATTMPDGSAVPDDLLTNDRVYDCARAGIVESFRQHGEKADDRVLTAMYSAILKIVKAKGGKYVIGVMDVDPVFEPLRKRGRKAWGEFAGIDHRTVMSRIPNSNTSTVAIGDMEKWEIDASIHRKVLYGLFWGNSLTKRSVAFAGLEGTKLPLFTAMPPNPNLSPAKLSALTYATPVLYMDLGAVGTSHHTFKEVLPGVDVHYAMKANPDKTVLRYLHGEGCGFEIASMAELRRLMSIGVDPATVLFSNPVKLPDHIRRAAAAGLYRFAFDSDQELEKIAQNAPGSSVYIRLATHPTNSKVHSEGKFGVDIEKAEQLMRQAGQLGLHAYGITFHVGSQVENAEIWRHAIRNSGELMRKLGGTTIRMLDMGGGFPATHKYGLPTLQDIAKVIHSSLASELPYMPRKLAIEPGRGLVSDAGVMMTTVIGVIERGGKKWVHLDLGGFTMFEALETGNTLDYPVADSRQSAERMISNIAAATCDSMDTILYNNNGLSADLTVGDRVFIYTAGAYTTAYASNFNGFPRPAIRFVKQRARASQMRHQARTAA